MSSTVTAMTENRKATWRIPDPIFRELAHLAIDDDRNVTELVIEALKDYLKKRGRPIK
jgi:hypothetical protein